MGIKSGVLLPACKALVTGIFAFIVFAILLSIRGFPNAWQLGLLVGAAVALISWLAVVLQKFKPVQLSPKETTVRLEIASDNGRRLQFADLPVDHDTLIRFAHGVMDGQSLTEAAWVGNGGIFSSRSEFVSLRDELIRRNLAEYRNPACPARGWVLTRSGLAAFRYLAESPIPNEGKEVKRPYLV